MSMHLLASGQAGGSKTLFCSAGFPTTGRSKSSTIWYARPSSRGALLSTGPQGNPRAGALGERRGFSSFCYRFPKKEHKCRDRKQPVLLSRGMALATVAIGHGLPFWPEERPPLGHER